MPGKSLLDQLAYNEAKKIIKLAIVDANHKILEDTTKKITDSRITLETPEIDLNQMRTEIFFIKPDFFDSPNGEKQNFLKKSIELYISSFENLCINLNKFIIEISKGLNNLNKPSLELQSEINNILVKFEDTIKNLCAPLISKREGLNTIDESSLTEEQKQELKLDKMNIDREILDFSDESEKLNKNYFRQFSQMSKSINSIFDSINEIPNPIKEYQNQLEEGISKFEEFLENITDENKDKDFDKELKNFREFFNALEQKAKDIKLESESKCKILDKQYKNRSDSFSQIKIKVKRKYSQINNEIRKNKI